MDAARTSIRAPGVKKHIPLGGNGKHPHYDDVFLKELALVPGMKFEAESEEDYETGHNRLGRVFESATSAHHMSEPHVNIHEDIKQRFMRSRLPIGSIERWRKGYSISWCWSRRPGCWANCATT